MGLEGQRGGDVGGDAVRGEVARREDRVQRQGDADERPDDDEDVGARGQVARAEDALDPAGPEGLQAQAQLGAVGTSCAQRGRAVDLLDVLEGLEREPGVSAVEGSDRVDSADDVGVAALAEQELGRLAQVEEVAEDAEEDGDGAQGPPRVAPAHVVDVVAGLSGRI